MKFAVGELALIWNPSLGKDGRDFSSFHKEECTIIAFLLDSLNDYEIKVSNGSTYYVRENELRKIDYDGDEKIEWEDERCVWTPEKETVDVR